MKCRSSSANSKGGEGARLALSEESGDGILVIKR
ncbi:MAG: hypothetical protein FD153_306, partial [Rhodospirillaceae bacterium]